MSKESTQYDLRVALYDSTKANIGQVVFFNDFEAVLECQRVILVREGSRLYFEKGDGISHSIKLSGPHKNILQIQRDFDKVKDLEGYYDIKYDNDSERYYIGHESRVADYDGHGYFMKGIHQVVHNPGDRSNKEGEAKITVRLTDHAKNLIKAKEEKEIKKNKNKATDAVIKALILLLKTQVAGNEEALSTIEALEKFI